MLVENPPFHLDGDYALSNNKISLYGDKLTYAGIATLHPRLFSNCNPSAFSLSPLLNTAIERGTVSGEIYRGPWFNVGTQVELERLKQALA